ncbi:hypothetical protein OMAG_002160 [Candidatus Omnitrophus magneticus]|uniref:Uncharacterized protein n=1 Tax=Candidatus Omnitrophus magneticus TaxID=1609969 RepID=A0A0F0CKY3_9BACT|nr:hypothetical protein OMAG_002160 [Candidatus Omnitrophus magneticus]
MSRIAEDGLVLIKELLVEKSIAEFLNTSPFAGVFVHKKITNVTILKTFLINILAFIYTSNFFSFCDTALFYSTINYTTYSLNQQKF